MKDKLKILILILLIIVVIAGIGYLSYNAVRSINYNKTAKNPIVTLDIEGYGQVKIELYPEYAPNTVTHFINLVQNGYYDGKVFHGTDGKSVHAGNMENKEEETSDENTDETANKSKVTTETINASYIDSKVSKDNDYEIEINGEFIANGFNDNTLRFEYGVVGLYRNQYGSTLLNESYNSGDSLFFISTEESSELNGMYAGFGKVISGMEIIEDINGLPTEESSGSSEVVKNFQTLPLITKATVDTFGVNYGIPEYHKAFDYNSYLSELFMQQYYNS